MANKHKYQVTIYLGKKDYEEMLEYANFLQVSIATATKIIFDTGKATKEAIDKVDCKSRLKIDYNKVRKEVLKYVEGK